MGFVLGAVLMGLYPSSIAVHTGTAAMILTLVCKTQAGLQDGALAERPGHGQQIIIVQVQKWWYGCIAGGCRGTTAASSDSHV